MSKGMYLLLGAAMGAAVGMALNYFLGPADGTTYDADYRSRLDFAFDEGRRAAEEKERDVRRQIIDFRQSKPNSGTGA